MLLKPLVTSLAILAIGATSSGCASESWITSLAPPRPAREAESPVKLTAGAAPEGTENLGIVRCRQLLSPDCTDLVKESARSVGGDIVYGAHWEDGYRTTTLVGTIGHTAMSHER